MHLRSNNLFLNVTVSFFCQKLPQITSFNHYNLQMTVCLKTLFSNKATSDI